MTSRTLARGASILLALALVPACAKSSHEAATSGHDEKERFGRMSVDELDAKMTAAKAGQMKLAVFDNNQRERFDKGHIPGAKWVAFDKVQASDLPADKDTTLVFYCANEH